MQLLERRLRSIAQPDQTGLRRRKNQAPIEAGEMRFEIDMQPFRAAVARDIRCHFDKPGRYSLSTEFGGDAGIEDKSMYATIPGNIDKTHQAHPVEGTDMGEASRQNRREIARGGFLPSCSPQGIERFVFRIGIDPEFDRHKSPLCCCLQRQAYPQGEWTQLAHKASGVMEWKSASHVGSRYDQSSFACDYRTQETAMAYVDGFVIAVPKDKIEIYKALARKAGDIWMEYGALSYVESIGDDVPYGELTSFPRSVQAKEDEVVIFSWITYESRQQRDAVMEKVMADSRLKDEMANMPFDGKRMIYGGFDIFLQL